MNIKRILFLIIVFVVASSLVYAAQDKTSKIKIVTKDVDMGEVEKGRIFDYNIEVKNVGTKDLTIQNVYSSCGCLAVTDKRWLAMLANNNTPKPEEVVIKPGHSIYISVNMDTNKVVGGFEKMLHVISDDFENKDAVWKIKGIALDLNTAGLVNQTPAPMPIVAEVIALENVKTITVFYSLGCGDCKEIMEKFLPKLKEKYKDRILIMGYNIDNPESLAFLLDLQNKYDKNIKKGGLFNPKPPAVFVGSRLLYGVKEIEEKLEEILWIN